MKKVTFCVSAILLASAITGCNGTGTTSTADSTSATTQTNSGDSAVTTTTTTTVVHHKYTGNFVPQPTTHYLDLRTHKQITVRVDTVQGNVVNTETNEPVDLFVDPVKHDTIYGQTGTVVNNYITKDDGGDYHVDTVRINTVVQAPADESTTEVAKGKYKSKGNGEKTKEKVK